MIRVTTRRPAAWWRARRGAGRLGILLACGAFFLPPCGLWAQTAAPAAARQPAPAGGAAAKPAAPGAPAGQSAPASQTAPAGPAAPTGQKPAAATPAAAPPPLPIPSPQPPAPNIPAAALVWSQVLDADAPTPLLPGSEALSLHSAVLAGDRVVVVYEAEPLTSRGGRPFTTWRLATLERGTGKVLAQRDLQDQARPLLFATDDEHLLLQQSGVVRLNPDLTESGEKFVPAGRSEGRRGLYLSADGGTLGLWTNGSTGFLDAHTLRPLGVRIRGPEPSAVGRRSLLADDPAWAAEFPGAAGFIVLKDALAPRLLYRGPCAGHPVFLGEDRILTVACGKVSILDLSGKLLKELPLGAAYGAFAGASIDGSRFAIESSDYPSTDPAWEASELFTLWDAATLAPVATVRPEALPDARSWAAFSQDGKSFLTGGPKKVSLYRTP